MASIFSKIIAGNIPCYKVAEDEHFFAFLDINPLVKGHTLVVPKREVDYIFDLQDEELAAFHVFGPVRRTITGNGRCGGGGAGPSTYGAEGRGTSSCAEAALCTIGEAGFDAFGCFRGCAFQGRDSGGTRGAGDPAKTGGHTCRACLAHRTEAVRS